MVIGHNVMSQHFTLNSMNNDSIENTNVLESIKIYFHLPLAMGFIIFIQ